MIVQKNYLLRRNKQWVITMRNSMLKAVRRFVEEPLPINQSICGFNIIKARILLYKETK